MTLAAGRTTLPATMLIGRGAERARIDELLAAARDGVSGVLVVWGEPGIGKTALLDYAAERGEDFRILRAIGVESETELAFSGLHELLRPVLEELRRLPERQATALRGALALGPPGEVDRFAVSAATLSLLAAVAERRPLLCLVDDVQWLDAASAEALLFAARRLAADRIAVLFAAREGEASALTAAGLPELWLSGLHEEAARALLAEHAAGELAPDVERRLIELSAGNPLALVELPGALTAAELAGKAPIQDPAPVPSRVEEAFRRRLERLSTEARSALLVAAASDNDDLATAQLAIEALGLRANALDESLAARLITVSDGRLHFRHPLIRSAVYRSADPADRRRAHAALAPAYPSPRQADRRAWHLAASVPGYDDDVAAALEQAAELARERGGAVAESRALERAARLTREPHARARRIWMAASAQSMVGGQSHVESLCREALSLTDDPELRGEIHKVLENTLYWGGQLESAHQVKLAVAEELEPVAPIHAAHMRARATASLTHMLRGADALEVARSAAELLHRHKGDDLRVPIMLAQALARVGAVTESTELAQACAVAIESAGELELRPNLAEVFVLLDEYDRAEAILAPSLRAARSMDAYSELSAILDYSAMIDGGRGRLLAAYASALESVAIAEQLEGERLQLAMSLTRQAVLAAELGREAEARDTAARAVDLAKQCGSRWLEAATRAALGTLELSLGRGEDAVEQMEAVGKMVRAGGYRNPAFVSFSPGLIEAYVRIGRDDEASRELERLEADAAEAPTPWSLAVACRCRALIAQDHEFEPAFQTALEHHSRSPRQVERARTQLYFGERLRREGRRGEARDQLREALDAFDAAGARLWADRSRAELAATGEHVRRDARASDDLTPQEMQVALVVTAGASNREAAAQLFLSPKTIEFHLRNIYRKLDVRSRTQLANAIRGRSEELAEASAAVSGPSQPQN